MTTSAIHKAGAFATVALALLAITEVSAQESPHWSKATCQTCHDAAAPVVGSASIKATDAEALCESCHGSKGPANKCRHRSGMQVGDLSIDDRLQGALKDGTVVCSTCHDIVYQCEHARIQYSFENPGFLRDRTSRHTANYCLRCHESTDYEQFNPHTIIAGDPAQPTCRFCHDALPETDESGEIRVGFNMRHDLNDTCRGCHNVRPHPRGMTFTPQDEGWNHLVVPPEDIRQNMDQAFAKSGTRLPLDPYTGKVFCATCHNQHKFRFGGDDASLQRVIENRLRRKDICQACHAK